MNSPVQAERDPFAGVPSVADVVGLYGVGTEEQGDPEDGTGVRRLRVIPASALRMRPAQWLWDRRIPGGAITLLTGREGIGKSTTSYDLIAKITRGTLPGKQLGTPRSVGIVATEDAWEEVILPRLVAAGADPERVFQFDAVNPVGDSVPLSVPADLPRVAVECTENDIVLIVLDPLMSVIPSGLDTHKDRDVRQALDPLAKFCASTGVSVLGLIHVNKSTTSDPLNSIMASRAFTAVARSVLYCIVDPEAEREDRFLFGHVKSNLGPKQPSLSYRIAQVTLEVEDEDSAEGDIVEIVTSRVIWCGEDARTIASVMDAPRAARPRGELATRILDWLAEQPGAVAAADIAREFSDTKRNTVDKTLRRLADAGQVVTIMRGVYGLPASDTTSDRSSLETSEESEVSDTSERLRIVNTK